MSIIRGWRRSVGRTLIAVSGCLFAMASSAAFAQPITVDPFTTNQAPLTLTFPPAGTTASSSVAGVDILGGERDIIVNLTAGIIAGNTINTTVSAGFYSYSQDATITGTGEVQWDGVDGSPTLNPTGLGGLDLTVGGSQNAFFLNVQFDDLPVDVTLEVFTDAGNASSTTFAAPGLIFTPTGFVIPYDDFTTTLGAGADFTDVGAIRLVLGSAVTAPDVVIDFLATTSSLTAPKTVAIFNDVDGDGAADPGDRLRYTIIVSNPDDAGNVSETGVIFNNPAPANTVLVNGSVTTTQGTVTTGNGAGDSSVSVNIGTIADGGSVTVTFDVTINNPLPAGVTQITCQGTVTSDSIPSLRTDDPTPPGPADPTVIPVASAPAIVAPKTSAIQIDTNGDGQLNPGETLRFTIVITNNGNQNAAGVVFNNLAPANTDLVVGSVTTTQGSVTTGNTAGDTSVSVAVGTIPGGGGMVTITFDVRVDDPLPAGVTQITCQGTVTGTNFPPTLTDNTGTATPNDPNVVPIVPQVVIFEVPTLQGWGLIALITLLAGFALFRLRRSQSAGTPA